MGEKNQLKVNPTLLNISYIVFSLICSLLIWVYVTESIGGETDEAAILQLRLGERHHGIEVAHVITHAHMRPHFKGFGVFKLGISLTKNSQATQNQ